MLFTLHARANAKFIPWIHSAVMEQQTPGQIKTILQLLFYTSKLRVDKNNALSKTFEKY